MLERGHTVEVLDRGYVKFIDSMGRDEDIVEAARMSTGRGFVSWEAYKRCTKCDQVRNFKDAELPCGFASGKVEQHAWQDFPAGDMGMLEFLYEHRHMTPFEMCELVIEVKAPIFVFREWHRHRTQSYNEFSARYAQMPNEHYLPELKRFQKQSTTNKQGSAEAFDEVLAAHCREQLETEQEAVYENYDELVQQGLAKEVARINTPVSRYSKMRAKANLRNWLSFLILRKQSHHSKPQWEIAQFANVVGDFIQQIYPKTYDLFMEHTFNAVTFSATEMKALRKFIQAYGDQYLQTYGPEAGLSPAKSKVFLTKLEWAP